MNAALWIAAWVLGLTFLAAGTMKLTQPKEKLAPTMGWVESVSAGSVKGIGAAEALGGIGLILPGLTGIAPVLVPLAATGLAITMVGAIITHLRRHEAQIIIVPVVPFAVAAFIAWGRFGPHPL